MLIFEYIHILSVEKKYLVKIFVYRKEIFGKHSVCGKEMFSKPKKKCLVTKMA